MSNTVYTTFTFPILPVNLLSEWEEPELTSTKRVSRYSVN